MAGLLSACANTNVAVEPNGVAGNVADATAKAVQNVFGATLIPDATLSIGPSVSYPLEKLVYWGLWVGTAYQILDPLAPNWEIQEARFPDNHVHMSLAMKRYYAGGAGEARVHFHRRAKELMRAGGYAGYEVVEYGEGMESSMLGAKRTATGVVRFSKSSG
jgi:hypothetical protein